MSPSVFSKDGLKKLTVPQLKNLCKETNVVGYSKLNKDAIIAKLLAHQSIKGTETALPQLGLPHSAKDIASGATVLDETSAISVATGDFLGREILTTPSVLDLQTDYVDSEVHLNDITHADKAAGTSAKESGHSSPQSSQRLEPPAGNIIEPSRKDHSPSLPSKRAAIKDLSKPKPKKKAKLDSASKADATIQPNNGSLAGTLLATESTSNMRTKAIEKGSTTTPVAFSRASGDRTLVVPGGSHTLTSSLNMTPTSSNENSTSLAKDTTQELLKPVELSKKSTQLSTIVHVPAPNRYKRLIPRNPNAALPSIPLPFKVPGNIMKTPPVNQESPDYMHLVYLEFPTTDQALSLHTIGLPPSVSQRKLVPRLSLILSGLSFDDLRTCALVSRAFRYSAYLSAAHQLRKRFPGVRLQKVLSMYAPQMTNFWPYLNARDHEAKSRRLTYESSFLYRALKNNCLISDRLWTSPDNEKQITIAVRFLLSRLFFCVSIGLPMEPGIIIDAQEVIENEIWIITYHSRTSSKETCYVLEPTCEVIGRALESRDGNQLVASEDSVREDWKAYISKANEESAQPEQLIDCLQWSNHEEYIKGISKIWLKRAEGEETIGSAKLAVARRYIMACVIGNSISGTWRSSTEMAQEFDGKISSRSMFTPNQLKLNLYLPFHHHVESVHFSSSGGRALHPAVAVVRTPGREYFILRDNGMQIGCEEEGIASVWMSLLQCCANGCKVN